VDLRIKNIILRIDLRVFLRFKRIKYKRMSIVNKALVAGVTGQDGSCLAELLLGKGYEVHGILRRASTFNTSRLEGIYSDPYSLNNNLHCTMAIWPTVVICPA
jgi:hypothetical protein